MASLNAPLLLSTWMRRAATASASSSRCSSSFSHAAATRRARRRSADASSSTLMRHSISRRAMRRAATASASSSRRSSSATVLRRHALLVANRWEEWRADHLSRGIRGACTACALCVGADRATRGRCFPGANHGEGEEEPVGEEVEGEVTAALPVLASSAIPSCSALCGPCNAAACCNSRALAARAPRHPLLPRAAAPTAAYRVQHPLLPEPPLRTPAPGRRLPQLLLEPPVRAPAPGHRSPQLLPACAATAQAARRRRLPRSKPLLLATRSRRACCRTLLPSCVPHHCRRLCAPPPRRTNRRSWPAPDPPRASPHPSRLCTPPACLARTAALDRVLAFAHCHRIHARRGWGRSAGCRIWAGKVSATVAGVGPRQAR
uniref:Uncharacterized protein n=1 Tax=Setaria viridis TaxID=4556 RepID=A0A4U6VQW2_SETVI|nr:hypothetical protein SEVIR_2G018200v2 [Setaria viridis]